MSALASFVTGRRTKWIVIALWVVAVAALTPLGAKLVDETQDDTRVVPAGVGRVHRGRRDPRRGVRRRRNHPGPPDLSPRGRPHPGRRGEDRRGRGGARGALRRGASARGSSDRPGSGTTRRRALSPRTATSPTPSSRSRRTSRRPPTGVRTSARRQATARTGSRSCSQATSASRWTPRRSSAIST